MQGKTINGFELKRQLGVGGMAEVWYAENEIGMKAAVKILSDELSRNAQMRERFLNEAKVMVKLDHPNIRKVYGYGSIDDRPTIIMEYLDGSDLKAKLKRGQRFSEAQLEKWWNQLVDALNYTHSQNIVHRDIKPSNIFLDNKDDVKLLDFGIAKVTDTTSGTLTGSTLGTRIYMSPEQVKDPKRVGTASDVYSLAVSFVHLLTGKAPYDSTTSSDYDIQVSIVNQPIDLSSVPKEWQNFLEPYLSKDPKQRPPLLPFQKLAVDNSKYAGFVNGNAIPHSSTIDDDETIAEGTKQSKPQFEQSEKRIPSAMPKPEKSTNDKPKNKKRIWIGIGAAVAVIVALLLALQKKPGKDLILNANGVPFVMKYVDGGTFKMGNDELEMPKPSHSVTLSPFYIGETEVTQSLWKAVMGDNPSEKIGSEMPVHNVSWLDCQEFINKLNQLTGKRFRLPTEAEWEYAARGGRESKGYLYAGSNFLEEVAEMDDIHVVKEKLPNELGIYDMSGNVWEWCNDWYGSYSNSAQTNPVGPLEGSQIVQRGFGLWNGGVGNEVYLRICDYPFCKDSPYGFRLCLPVDEQSSYLSGVSKPLPYRPNYSLINHHYEYGYKVKERNLMNVFLRWTNSLWLNGRPFDPSELKDEIVNFITPNPSDENSPEVEYRAINGIGNVMIPKGVVCFVFQGEEEYENVYRADLDQFCEVVEAIASAYAEARDNLAMKVFHKHLKQLDQEQIMAIRNAIPARVVGVGEYVGYILEVVSDDCVSNDGVEQVEINNAFIESSMSVSDVRGVKYLIDDFKEHTSYYPFWVGKIDEEGEWHWTLYSY
jgi:predicted Ser/Thr protein kinase